MMDRKLTKERLYLFSPCATVSTVVTIGGDISPENLTIAINKAACKNEILNTEIHMDPDQSASYQVVRKESFPVSCTNQSWQEVMNEQIKIRFDIEKGELIRFFILKGEANLQLLILNHHLAGDGLSISYLVEDIMNCLSGKQIEEKPICLMDTRGYKTVLPILTRLMAKNLNKTWERTKTIFSDTDRQALFEHYWENRDLRIFSHTFESDILNRLTGFCKEKEITVNSLLLTACYCTGASRGIGISVDCRPRESKTMGNYAIGVSIPYEYNHNLDFGENAIKVHELVYQYLGNDKKKLFLMQFMNIISGTLIDASYFVGFHDYQDKTAGMIANMFGFNGNPQGVSLSNLTKLPIASDYGDFRLTDYRCIPPLVPNLRRILGAATLNHCLSLTMSVAEGPELEEEGRFFKQVVDTLMSI